jgi:spore coat protein U-like protein
VSSCQVSTTATASGTYAVTRANVATSVSVACTNPTPYNVSYSTELAPSVSVTTRKTAGSASDSPGHVPFSDSAHTGIWDRTADAGTVAGTGSGSFQLYAGYGQSARAQHVAPGAFADTVTVTITY